MGIKIANNGHVEGVGMISVKEIRVEVESGTQMFAVQQNAMLLAMMANCPVVYEFNGKDYVANPSDAAACVKMRERDESKEEGDT